MNQARPFCRAPLRFVMTRATLMLAALTVAAVPVHAADGFLEAGQAFKLSARVLDTKRLEVRFDIAPGYYLYRDKFNAASAVPGVAVAPLEVPPGKVKFDENFGKNIEYFRDSVVMVLPVQAGAVRSFTVDVGNQGCADKGLCYPPMKRPLTVQADANGLVKVGFAQPAAKEPASNGMLSRLLGNGGKAEASSPATVSTPELKPPLPVATPPASPASRGEAGGSSKVSLAEPAFDPLSSSAGSVAPAAPSVEGAPSKAPDSAAADAAALSGADGRFEQVLASGKLLAVAGVFFVGGLMLSLTPCVLPMLPILSSIILGNNERVSRARGFALALSYSLGMAALYTCLGIAAGKAGGGLGAYLQNAWVLVPFGVLMVVLSLSMFDVYELQMPQGLHNGLSGWSGRFKGGRFASVFVMGAVSAAIVSPCIAPPLGGALVYIATTGDVVLGGLALFSLAMGMSVPLLMLGVSAGVIPRSGGWMKHVKHLFGVAMLGLALWIVSPVTPSWLTMVGVAVLLLASAVYLGAFEPLNGHTNPGRSLTKGIGLLLALMGAVQLIGVASGGRDLWQPLGQLTGSQAQPPKDVGRSGEAPAAATAGAASASSAATTSLPGAAQVNSSAMAGPLRFQPIQSVEGLEAAVKASAKPVMLDFYADWCSACIEFERLTLSDAQVRARLEGMTLLRADVTANNEQDRALMRKYRVFAPPTMVFIRAGGEEVAGTRLLGTKSATDFLAHLARIDGALVAR